MHEEAVELGPLGVRLAPRRALQGVKASPIQSQGALVGDRLEDTPIHRLEGAAPSKPKAMLPSRRPSRSNGKTRRARSHSDDHARARVASDDLVPALHPLRPAFVQRGGERETSIQRQRGEPSALHRGQAAVRGEARLAPVLAADIEERRGGAQHVMEAADRPLSDLFLAERAREVRRNPFQQREPALGGGQGEGALAVRGEVTARTYRRRCHKAAVSSFRESRSAPFSASMRRAGPLAVAREARLPCWSDKQVEPTRNEGCRLSRKARSTHHTGHL